MSLEASLSPDVMAARRIAYTLAKAEAALGIHHTINVPFSYRMETILSGAMENPGAVDEATYSLAYRFLQSDTANVGHPDLKQQPGGPLHKPKPEPQKQ
ncbi:hypothetical protein IVB45_18580 [Bradyrhizobium sp. 4]|uniref:hypothetical protein n=1 Tax=unclassified Bradyrhizobium TaxID=2631580 RepID=UPI001FFA82DF|nr:MULTISPECIES: hypothetical protein [unclassified Bradyrhizobium]MCK1400128.1 hypothetical protein [Bradyrhizobium sp. 39]MCK1750418.1 hypothetical protein [Bradyrhizobium sp. 135]UPJ32027.1 hypothetical protein IVB45_18580 [Bradyrhizobium sp. 4]